MGRKEKEKWRYVDIKGIKKKYYLISSWGRVKIEEKDKFLKPYEDKDGYLKCTLFTENGKRKHFFIHRLVALHYIPNPLNKPQVNHLRPKYKQDNYYKYLEWSTVKENIRDSLANKCQTFVACEAHGYATLTNKEVHKICQLMQDGYKNKEIITEFGIVDKKERERFRGVLKHIRSRKTWKAISRNYNF